MGSAARDSSSSGIFELSFEGGGVFLDSEVCGSEVLSEELVGETEKWLVLQMSWSVMPIGTENGGTYQKEVLAVLDLGLSKVSHVEFDVPQPIRRGLEAVKGRF